MSLPDHVSLTISTSAGGTARPGFGVPLILSATATFAARVEYVTTLADVIALGFVASSPEYLQVSALLSQSPHPSRIAIGRCALPPTQKYEWTPVAKNTHIYILNVMGEGVTAEAVDYTSDASATIAEVSAGMLAALNAVVGKNFTATGGVTSVVVTATAAGDWFSVEQDDITDGKIEQTHVDPGVGTDLTAIDNEQSDWYCLLTHFNSSAYVLAAAAWIETTKKIFLADCNDSEGATLAVAGGDLLDDIYTANSYERTTGQYHPCPGEFLAAGLAGAWLWTEPGASTAKFRTLAGVAPVVLTATHRTNIRAKKGNTYETVYGRNITWEGTRGDGLFIDLTRDLDWLYYDMAGAVYDCLAGASNAGEKIPFTNPGIAVIQGEIMASLLRGVARGILADDPAPVVLVPDVADISAADKATRTLPDITWVAYSAGAIHKVQIQGVVSL